MTNLSWSVDVRTHAIAQLVDKVLSQPWAAAEEMGREVPPLKRQDDCVVSFRIPRHNIALRHKFAHPRCRIASNGTLGITAYDRHSISSICPYMRLPKTPLKVIYGSKHQSLWKGCLRRERVREVLPILGKKFVLFFLRRMPSRRLGGSNAVLLTF